jgi:hypothetical protein
LSRDRVAVDGVWIGNRIYWTHKHTTCDYTLEITIRQWLVFSATVSLRCLVTSSTVDVLLLPGSRPRRLATISHQPPTLITTVSRHCCNGGWSSLYSLGKNRTENTASIIAFSLVAREATCSQSYSLTTAVSLARQFLLWAHVPMCLNHPNSSLSIHNTNCSGKITSVSKGTLRQTR